MVYLCRHTGSESNLLSGGLVHIHPTEAILLICSASNIWHSMANKGYTDIPSMAYHVDKNHANAVNSGAEEDTECWDQQSKTEEVVKRFIY